MNILIVNDDGITEGLYELANALASIEDAELFVVVPDSERSAASHSMSYRDTLTVERIDAGDFVRVKEAYTCSGTPADCTKIGVAMLRQRGISVDMVCSGINLGANLGIDTHYSGTVSAAVEGSLLGIRSLAFSVNVSRGAHFDSIRPLIPALVTKCRHRQPVSIVLNVNCPDLPAEEVKGIKVTKVRGRRYRELYTLQEGTESRFVYGISAEVFPMETLAHIDGDVKYNAEGWITITPVESDNSTEKMVKELTEWVREFKK